MQGGEKKEGEEALIEIMKKKKALYMLRNKRGSMQRYAPSA